jgi:hypothetical protein
MIARASGLRAPVIPKSRAEMFFPTPMLVKIIVSQGFRTARGMSRLLMVEFRLLEPLTKGDQAPLVLLHRKESNTTI